MKEFFIKVKKVILSIFTCIGIVASAIATYCLFFRKDDKPENTIDVEEIEDEIKNTDSSDIIADSPNQSDISASIEQQQTKFRERVRDRLK